MAKKSQTSHGHVRRKVAAGKKFKSLKQTKDYFG
jgi:hypothetical protein